MNVDVWPAGSVGPRRSFVIRSEDDADRLRGCCIARADVFGSESPLLRYVTERILKPAIVDDENQSGELRVLSVWRPAS